MPAKNYKQDPAIAARLRYFRKKYVGAGLNEAADILGVTNRMLSNCETGKQEIGVPVVAPLMKKYGLNPFWLLFNEGEETVKKPKDQPAEKDLTDIKVELELLKAKIEQLNRAK